MTMMTNAQQRLLGLRIWAPNYFNPLCNFAAFTFLMASAIHGICSRPVTNDFGQYYMGGLIAREGQWDSLYPIPKPGSEDHPGYPHASILRPKYAELMRAAGVDDNARFILAPPVALLCIPFTLINYKAANGVWVLLMSVCLWLVALQAARIYRNLQHRPSRVEGLLVVFIACSPLCRFAMRIGNVTPFVGLCVGAAAIGLIGEDRIRSPLGLVLGALGKFVTLVLVPLYVLVRKWRVLALFLLVLILINLATITLSGKQPYVTFLAAIVPTLDRPSEGVMNLSVHGFLLNVYGRGRVPRAASDIVRTGELVLILLGATGLLRSLGGLSKDAAKLFAASLAMIGGVLIFSPQTWGHYLVYLLPFWGYLVWESQQSLCSRWIVVGALPFLWAPPAAIRSIDAFERIRLPAVAEVYDLWALLLVTSLAILRLHGVDRGQELSQFAGAPVGHSELPS